MLANYFFYEVSIELIGAVCFCLLVLVSGMFQLRRFIKKSFMKIPVIGKFVLSCLVGFVWFWVKVLTAFVWVPVVYCKSIYNWFTFGKPKISASVDGGKTFYEAEITDSNNIKVDFGKPTLPPIPEDAPNIVALPHPVMKCFAEFTNPEGNFCDTRAQGGNSAKCTPKIRQLCKLCTESKQKDNIVSDEEFENVIKPILRGVPGGEIKPPEYATKAEFEYMVKFVESIFGELYEKGKTAKTISFNVWDNEKQNIFEFIEKFNDKTVQLQQEVEDLNTKMDTVFSTCNFTLNDEGDIEIFGENGEINEVITLQWAREIEDDFNECTRDNILDMRQRIEALECHTHIFESDTNRSKTISKPMLPDQPASEEIIAELEEPKKVEGTATFVNGAGTPENNDQQEIDEIASWLVTEPFKHFEEETVNRLRVDFNPYNYGDKNIWQCDVSTIKENIASRTKKYKRTSDISHLEAARQIRKHFEGKIRVQEEKLHDLWFNKIDCNNRVCTDCSLVDLDKGSFADLDKNGGVIRCKVDETSAITTEAKITLLEQFEQEKQEVAINYGDIDKPVVYAEVKLEKVEPEKDRWIEIKDNMIMVVDEIGKTHTTPLTFSEDIENRLKRFTDTQKSDALNLWQKWLDEEFNNEIKKVEKHPSMNIEIVKSLLDRKVQASTDLAVMIKYGFGSTGKATDPVVYQDIENVKKVIAHLDSCKQVEADKLKAEYDELVKIHTTHSDDKTKEENEFSRGWCSPEIFGIECEHSNSEWCSSKQRTLCLRLIEATDLQTRINLLKSWKADRIKAIEKDKQKECKNFGNPSNHNIDVCEDCPKMEKCETEESRRLKLKELAETYMKDISILRKHFIAKENIEIWFDNPNTWFERLTKKMNIKEHEACEKIIAIYESSSEYFDAKVEEFASLLDSKKNCKKVVKWIDTRKAKSNFQKIMPVFSSYEESEDYKEMIPVIAKAESCTPLQSVLKLVQIIKGD